MKGNLPRLAESRFWLISYWILIGNERKLASAASEQILVDLLLNSNRKWKEIGLGWFKCILKLSEAFWSILKESEAFWSILKHCEAFWCILIEKRFIHSKINQKSSGNAWYIRKSTNKVVKTLDTLENQPQKWWKRLKHSKINKKSGENAWYIRKSTTKW